MNEDHAFSVHIMAKDVVNVKSGWKISDAHLQSVSLVGCKLRVFVCNGDLCEMVFAQVPFKPALQSSTEVRRRLISIHNHLTMPKFHWIMTRPTALVIVSIEACIVYGILIMGVQKLISTIDGDKIMFAQNISQVFGSAETFVGVLHIILWVTIIAHSYEGLSGVYMCRNTLKLGVKHQIMWFILIFIVGFPIYKELSHLAQIAISKKTGKEKV